MCTLRQRSEGMDRVKVSVGLSGPGGGSFGKTKDGDWELLLLKGRETNVKNK